MNKKISNIKKIAINSSNLHVGGGVQVATSFIDELSRLNIKNLSISIFVSSEVNANLMQMGTDSSTFTSFKVIDVYGLSALQPRFWMIFSDFDLVFTDFGPDYFLTQNGVRLTGFAQGWIIYPNNEIYPTFSFSKKLKNRLKFKLQSWFFKRSSKFIVELEHVKTGLIYNKIADCEDIFVVNNCLSSLYFTPKKWLPIEFDFDSKKFSIGFIGRDYPNKNTAILCEIKILLYNRYGLDVNFYVTLNAKEWFEKSDNFKESIQNVGALTVAQCPFFYQKMDAIIFPSMLECFSATPLEAMFMERPLFSSDRDFVRDVCGDFGLYFDPTSPLSAADLIATYIRERVGRDKERLRAAHYHVINFSNARQRAINYMNIIEDNLELK
jgi:glycosyltransferase involved in cell wall biosynthesis